MATVLGIGTAVPDTAYSQSDLARWMVDDLGLADEPRREVLQLAERSAIERRAIVADPHHPRDLGGTARRNELYCERAPGLAMRAARDLFARVPGADPRSVTHVVAVSCTGVMAPGIDVLLAQGLGLDPHVARFGLNMMGCFGAFRGLHLAKALADQSPEHRVLLVCVELCSLHYQPTAQPDALVSSLLFADGAAAVLLQRDAPGGLFELERFASAVIPDTRDEMTWRAGDHGFEMRLSRRVPVHIKRNVADFAAGLVPREQWGEALWALHPGGKAILAAIEDSCGLRREQTSHSWDVLRDFGNMSSATVLFVLDRLRGRSPNARVCALGFGPGLSVEGMTLVCR